MLELENSLNQVNARLQQNGGGSIFFRWFDQHTRRSKNLYAKYYPFKGAKPVEIYCKSDDPEAAYVELLDAKSRNEQGQTMLPQQIAGIRYEHLIKKLMDYYREHHPASIYTRKTEDGKDEETFSGKDEMDKYFARLPILMITPDTWRDFVKYQRRNGFADPSIRRQGTRLRSAFNLLVKDGKITRAQVPYFDLPKDSEPRQGFIEEPDFNKLRDKMPERLRATVEFQYLTGARTGTVKQITWGMVSKNCDKLIMPGSIFKTKNPITLPLVGLFEPIAKTLRSMTRQFPNQPVFDFRNFRKEWGKACHALGFGKFDASTCNYTGLRPHDFRRSAAMNLTDAGLSESEAMCITGHKTNAMFKRYNIQTENRLSRVLLKAQEQKDNVAAMGAR